MTVLAVIVTAFILYLIIKVHAQRTPSTIGKVGENIVSYVLHSLPPEYLVLNDLIIPDQTTSPNKKYTTQIDHVVVSPYGIFVIETKNYGGWIFGTEKGNRWKQTFKTTQGHNFYNPVKQNWGHTFALAKQLHIDIRVFKPIVVFADDCELRVDTITPVIYMSQLKDFILSYTQEIMPREDAVLLFDRISRINIIEDDAENNHIQSIQDRFSERTNILNQGRCPRCGGELKLRNGKYGSFYGCSNYPKCTFTYSVR